MADSNAPEHQDRGLLGMFGKKKEDETHQQHGTAVDTHGHGHVEGGKSHGEGEEKKHGKLHRSNSSSSSSSDEEEDEKGEKKKKKKGGLKDKIKLPGHKKEEEHGYGKTEEHELEKNRERKYCPDVEILMKSGQKWWKFGLWQ